MLRRSIVWLVVLSLLLNQDCTSESLSSIDSISQRHDSETLLALRVGCHSSQSCEAPVAANRLRGGGDPEIHKRKPIQTGHTQASVLSWPWQPSSPTSKQRGQTSNKHAGAAIGWSPRRGSGVVASEYEQDTIFVGGTKNLDEGALVDGLTPLFGTVLHVHFPRDPVSGPKGYAFITFKDVSSARKALAARSATISSTPVTFGPSEHEFNTVSVPPDAGNKVFLGGTRDFMAEDIQPILERYGKLEKLEIVVKPDNIFMSAGFGFATFNSTADARRLLSRGMIVLNGTRIDIRTASRDRPPLSTKVSLSEADELVEALKFNIEKVRLEAPGGYHVIPGVHNEGIVIFEGTEMEQTVSQTIPDEKIPLDKKGRTVLELEEMYEDSLVLQRQVFDCLCDRAKTAAMCGDLKQLQELVEEGADPDAPERMASLSGDHTLGKYNPYGPRCLFLAAREGHTDVCSFLLDQGASIDHICIPSFTPAVTTIHYTALLAAVEAGHLETVKLLLKNGADPNFSDPCRQWTVLHWAACNGHIQVIQALVDSGADLTAMSVDGLTPSQLAAVAGTKDAEELLKSLSGSEAEQ